MTNFLERNKKNGAGPRLVAKRDRRLIPLAVLVGLFSLLFAAPASLLSRIPFVGGAASAVNRVAARLGFPVLGESSGKQDFADLMAAFKVAKDHKGSLWGAFLRGGTGSPAQSSMDLVTGRQAEFEAPVKPVAGGASINGILDREQGREGDVGVSIAQDDLGGERAGLAASAFAGTSAFAAKDFFAAASSAGDRRGDNISVVLAGTEPASIDSKAKVGPSQGRLSRAQVAAMSGRTRASLDLQLAARGQKAFAQLADSRALQLSRSPACSRGCAEYSSGLTGAVYDGRRAPSAASRPATLTAPLVGGAEMPLVTSAPSGPLQQQAYAQEADRLAAASESCLKADLQYDPEEKRLASVLESRSHDLNASDRKRACLAYSAVRCQHMVACPLTAANGCTPSDCDR